mgnify:CR=1 FL=1
MTSIEDFTSQYGLVQKIDAFGYLDYLKSNPDAPRKHGKVVLVTADTPLKASRGEGKTTTTIALIDALRERGIARQRAAPAEHGHRPQPVPRVARRAAARLPDPPGADRLGSVR